MKTWEHFFKVVKVSAESDKVSIVCGNMQATLKTFETEEEAEKYIETKPWDLIFTLMLVVKNIVDNNNK